MNGSIMQHSLEIRRIQITGGSSYMVTLPKNWIISNGLKKNDSVTIVPQPDGGLLLTTGRPSGMDSTKTLCVDDFPTPESLYRGLIGTYIAGHDQIILESSNPITGTYLEVISEFTQTSMGMEIVEEEEDRILIKDLINHSEVIPQKNVKREYLLVKRMITDALSESPPASGEMELRDTEVDRIHWLIQRQASIHQQDFGLSSSMGLNISSVTRCIGVSKMLERLGDHTVLIVKNREALSAKGKTKIWNCITSIVSDLTWYIESSAHSWMNADNSLAEEVISCKSKILRKIATAFSEDSEDTQVNMIQGSLTRIVEYCSDMAESAINIAMETSRPE